MKLRCAKQDCSRTTPAAPGEVWWFCVLTGDSARLKNEAYDARECDLTESRVRVLLRTWRAFVGHGRRLGTMELARRTRVCGEKIALAKRWLEEHEKREAAPMRAEGG